MIPFNARELATFGAFFGVSVGVMSFVGLLTGSVLEDRRSVAVVLVPAGILVAGFAVRKLACIKRTEPPQTWR